MIPTFVVIPGLNRHQMTADLLTCLEGQGATILLYDNGSSPAYDFGGCEIIDATGWPLHRMWADGIQTARDRAPVCNIAILNNDLLVWPHFLRMLSTGLRLHGDTWIAYPDIHGIRPGLVLETRGNGQTISGYAFMIRGESPLTPDESFHFWYGDWDLEMQAHAAGAKVVTVGGCYVQHLEPALSTRGERLEQARTDEKTFAAKWNLNPNSLFLAQNPGFGQ